jgi:type IV pilus assembly protein PilB
MTDKRMCAPELILEALSRQTGMATIDLDREPLDLSLASLITAKVAEQHRVVPLRLEGSREETLVVAIAAPASLVALDAVQAVSRKARVVPRLASDAAIDRALGKLYRGYAGAETRPTAAKNEPIVLTEQTFELAAPRVLIYGFIERVTESIRALLTSRGLSARPALVEEVVLSGADEVVFAPLPALEALCASHGRPHAALVVVAHSPEDDLPRARALGARGFVAAPMDPELVVRAVKRCSPARG